MKKLKAYIIEFAQLSIGNHHFTYKADGELLSHFEQDVLKNIDISVNLDLKKGDALSELIFLFNGKVSLICDRSLEEFDFPLQFEQKLFLKYGDEYEELSEELIQIPFNFQEIDIAQFIFEFVFLQLPAKKIHPKYNNEEDFFFSTETREEEIKEDNIDPRWENLKKLKNKN